MTWRNAPFQGDQEPMSWLSGDKTSAYTWVETQESGTRDRGLEAQILPARVHTATLRMMQHEGRFQLA